MSTVEVADGTDVGTLSNNFMFVNGLRSALSKTETNISAVVKSLRVVITDHCWRHWLDPTNGVVRWNAADFREFIETPWPKGCGVPIHVVIKALTGSDVLAMFLDMIRPEKGGVEGNSGNPSPNPFGRAGRPKETTGRDSITTSCLPPVIPFTPPFTSTVPAVQPTPAPPAQPILRNSRRNSPTGTSVSYTLRRLQKQAPELAAEVMRGGLSPHAAAVRAGLHEVKVTVPRDHPVRAAKILRRRLSPGQLAELVAELSRPV